MHILSEIKLHQWATDITINENMLNVLKNIVSRCKLTIKLIWKPLSRHSVTYCVPLILFQDEIRKAVKDMLQKFGTQRYIANLGHGVMKETNPDSVGVFIDAVHSLSEEINAQSWMIPLDRAWLLFCKWIFIYIFLIFFKKYTLLVGFIIFTLSISEGDVSDMYMSTCLYQESFCLLSHHNFLHTY